MFVVNHCTAPSRMKIAHFTILSAPRISQSALPQAPHQTESPQANMPCSIAASATSCHGAFLISQYSLAQSGHVTAHVESGQRTTLKVKRSPDFVKQFFPHRVQLLAPKKCTTSFFGSEIRFIPRRLSANSWSSATRRNSGNRTRATSRRVP